MEWTAETASHEMCAGLDTTKTSDEVRAYYKQYLQAAFDAGRQHEHAIMLRVVMANTPGNLGKF